MLRGEVASACFTVMVKEGHKSVVLLADDGPRALCLLVIAAADLPASLRLLGVSIEVGYDALGSRIVGVDPLPKMILQEYRIGRRAALVVHLLLSPDGVRFLPAGDLSLGLAERFEEVPDEGILESPVL